MYVTKKEEGQGELGKLGKSNLLATPTAICYPENHIRDNIFQLNIFN
jgi:hypothetical protein